MDEKGRLANKNQTLCALFLSLNLSIREKLFSSVTGWQLN